MGGRTSGGGQDLGAARTSAGVDCSEHYCLFVFRLDWYVCCLFLLIPNGTNAPELLYSNIIDMRSWGHGFMGSAHRTRKDPHEDVAL